MKRRRPAIHYTTPTHNGAYGLFQCVACARHDNTRLPVSLCSGEKRESRCRMQAMTVIFPLKWRCINASSNDDRYRSRYRYAGATAKILIKNGSEKATCALKEKLRMI